MKIFSVQTLLRNLNTGAMCTVLLATGFFVGASSPKTCYAENTNILTSEGIAGQMDRQHRSPVLNLEVKYLESSVKIEAQASIPNEEYKKYPIQFQFYVNRNLVSTQFSAPELPGDASLEIAPALATPPFNYVVVATVLHPNRSFSTATYGAVYALDLVRTFDCTLTLDSGSQIFVGSETTSAQPLNDQITLNFDGKSGDGGSTAVVSAVISIKDTKELTLSAQVQVDLGKASTSYNLDGTFEKDGHELSGITLKNSDESVTLSCS